MKEINLRKWNRRFKEIGKLKVNKLMAETIFWHSKSKSNLNQLVYTPYGYQLLIPRKIKLNSNYTELSFDLVIKSKKSLLLTYNSLIDNISLLNRQVIVEPSTPLELSLYLKLNPNLLDNSSSSSSYLLEKGSLFGYMIIQPYTSLRIMKLSSNQFYSED